jgi:hypothetical protein
VLGFHTTRADLGAYTGALSNLIPLVTLFLLLRRKRDAIYDGRLSLAAGIGAGMYASFVAALLVYTFLVTYTHFLNPIWIDQVLEHKVALWRERRLAETAIQAKITQFRDAYTPLALAGSTLVGLPLMGGVFGLLLTLVVRQLPHRPV